MLSNYKIRECFFAFILAIFAHLYFKFLYHFSTLPIRAYFEAILAKNRPYYLKSDNNFIAR